MSGARQKSNAAQEPFGVDEASSAGGPVGLTENEKLVACLSYASQLILPAVLPIILLLTEEYKRSPFVRHHAVESRQGLKYRHSELRRGHQDDPGHPAMPPTFTSLPPRF